MPGRRRLFLALCALSGCALVALLAATLARGGIDLWDMAMLACFAVTVPWTVIGFWNAVVGWTLLSTRADPARAVFPGLAAAGDTSPITTRTALLMCVRNEDAETVARHLEVMMCGLSGQGVAAQFSVYVLSDSNLPGALRQEAAVFGQLRRRWRGHMQLRYRRRPLNTGFKAGNIQDFCRRWGNRHDYALVLDADSLMDARTVLRMVRTLQRCPRVGILQSLVVGMPTHSPFARVFQFGMRLGMLSYTLGSAWWQADCGPYWGHNALLRLRPFARHCQLPRLPGGGALGGDVLSHDQVEAALMRRAGFEVRVLAEEGGSWEQNPPSLTEHIRRDLRWCQGNMQYWRLLRLPGLRPVSRVQLLLAILMYLGSPAWVGFMALAALRTGLAGSADGLFAPAPGWLLFGLILGMVFAPKLASLAIALARPARRQAFGGAGRLLAGALAELLLSSLLAPVLALAHTVFMAGLPFGHAAVWSHQQRRVQHLSAALALRRLWPQTAFGALLAAWLSLRVPTALPGFLPFLLGSLAAVPFAMLSAHPGLGRFLAERGGLWRIPEEHRPVPELAALSPRPG